MPIITLACVLHNKYQSFERGIGGFDPHGSPRIPTLHKKNTKTNRVDIDPSIFSSRDLKDASQEPPHLETEAQTHGRVGIEGKEWPAEILAIAPHTITPECPYRLLDP